MEMRKTWIPICFIVVMVCLLDVPVWAEGAKSQMAAPEGWPGQVGKRELYSSEFGYVYAGSKSSVAKMEKIVLKVTEELDKEGIEPGAKGLVLVLDKKEKPPFEAETLLAKIARKQSEKENGEDLDKALEALEDGKEEMEELGLDLNFILSIAPLPVEPNLLPGLIKGFPRDAGEQIDWCMTIPTESNIKYGLKKMLAAGLKKEKIGVVEQVALFPFLAIAENKAYDELKKARQSVIYQFFLEDQEGLTEKQKEEKVKAFQERL
ncbi:MAG: hypothetical protein JXM79_24770 [Sedimentisphaerales bacterium]|nr:hypothetical protein [Sedimentisphaerales bacterium]